LTNRQGGWQTPVTAAAPYWQLSSISTALAAATTVLLHTCYIQVWRQTALPSVWTQTVQLRC